MKNFNYKHDEENNRLTILEEKPKNIANFKFEDFDKGLVYKEAKDILDEYELRRLPSEYMDKSIGKVCGKLGKVEKYLNDIGLKLKDRARIKFNKKLGFNLARPLSRYPRPKTRELIEKYYILMRYAHNLSELKKYKENMPSKKGQGILHFNNPFQLLDRLELLGGSILAGNNGVM